jgi:hypothetical protein
MKKRILSTLLILLTFSTIFSQDKNTNKYDFSKSISVSIGGNFTALSSNNFYKDANQVLKSGLSSEISFPIHKLGSTTLLVGLSYGKYSGSLEKKASNVLYQLNHSVNYIGLPFYLQINTSKRIQPKIGFSFSAFLDEQNEYNIYKNGELIYTDKNLPIKSIFIEKANILIGLNVYLFNHFFLDTQALFSNSIHLSLGIRYYIAP